MQNFGLKESVIDNQGRLDNKNSKIQKNRNKDIVHSSTSFISSKSIIYFLKK